jgi:hypothetical protein
MQQERQNMQWDLDNIENMECTMFLNTDDLESCYQAWTQETLHLNTGPWLSSSLHSPNKYGMIEAFTEYWA